MKHKNRLLFVVTVVLVACIGTFLYIYYAAPLVYDLWEQAAVQHGQLSGAGVPINTLYTEPTLPGANYTTKSKVLLPGMNRDTLYTYGVLDLSKGPEVLHVPEIADRYYDIEFVDSRGDDFAYVGSRTTGGQAGNFLISGPGWQGIVPSGVTQMDSPDNSVILFGRVLVQNATDVSVAYNLSTQIKLTPLSSWQPSSG